MPIDKSKYPKNWNEISAKTKRKYNYTCLFCLRPKAKRNPMTTHHIDWDSMHNLDNNLVCLHASCHLLFHSTFRSCRTPSTFWEICRNHWSQQKFPFEINYLTSELTEGFIRQYIGKKLTGGKRCQSILAESSSPSLQ